MKYVKIYDDKMRQTALADIEQNYDKSGYVKVFDNDMQPIGVMDVDSIPESGANLPFVKVYDENLVMTGVVSVDNISHSDGYLITLQKDPSTTGSVSGGGRFVSGTSVTVVATPDAQSEYTEFDGWYEGDTKVSENASYTFTVSGARTLVAKFAEPTPTPVTPFNAQTISGQEVTLVGVQYISTQESWDGGVIEYPNTPVAVDGSGNRFFVKNGISTSTHYAQLLIDGQTTSDHAWADSIDGATNDNTIDGGENTEGSIYSWLFEQGISPLVIVDV